MHFHFLYIIFIHQYSIILEQLLSTIPEFKVAIYYHILIFCVRDEGKDSVVMLR